MGFTTSASQTCQVRSSIRTITELPYQTMAAIFKNEIPYNEKEHKLYFLGFFEECYPELIKRFMEDEENLSKSSQKILKSIQEKRKEAEQ